MRSVVIAAALLLISPLFGSCGDTDETPSVTPTPTVSATPSPIIPQSPTPVATATLTPMAPTTSPTGEPFDGTKDPVEKVGNTPFQSVAVLYDVRYAAHETFDRLVFDFRDGRPGYRIEYVQPPIVQDGSGLPVEIAGSAFLQIRFNIAVAHDDLGQSTYLGPREIFPGLESMLEVEMTGDFEGYVTWVLGVPRELEFRVSELTDPYRIAVDVAHP